MASVFKLKCEYIIIQELNIQFMLAPIFLTDSSQYYYQYFWYRVTSVIKLSRQVIHSYSINNFVKERFAILKIFIFLRIYLDLNTLVRSQKYLWIKIFCRDVFSMSKETVKHYLYYVYLFLIRWFLQTSKSSSGLSISDPSYWSTFGSFIRNVIYIYCDRNVINIVFCQIS